MFPFVWKLYAIILPVSIVAYTDDCTSLPPLTYCPPHDSARWRERAYCKHCPGHLKYHCCKDYDSPKLNCSQGDFYCKNETFVDGCAEEKFCGKGEEPVLNFIINQERVEKPEVHCVPCYNNNRYNDFKNRSSATYSECPYRKENICTPERNKIECNKPSETSERICRCDVKNGFYPYSHPNDHPEDGCSNSHYSCATGRCRQNEMMILNYTCVCKEGFLRINASNDCVSNHTTTSSTSTQKVHMNTTVSTSSTKSSQTITTALCSSQSILNTSTEATLTCPGTDGSDIVMAVLITIAGCIFLGAIIAIAWWKVHSRRKKKKKDKNEMVPYGMQNEDVDINDRAQQPPFTSYNQRQKDSDTNENNEEVHPLVTRVSHNQRPASSLNLSIDSQRFAPHRIQIDINDSAQQPSLTSNNHSMDNIANIEDLDTNEKDKDVNSLLIPGNQASVSTLTLSKYSKGSHSTFSGTQDSINKPLNRIRSTPTDTNSLDRQRRPKTNTGKMEISELKKECPEIGEDIVKDVVQSCYLYMIEHLEPDIVLDVFTNYKAMNSAMLRDIKEKKETSEKNRNILDGIRRNYKLYELFKKSLKDTGQTSCLEKLNEQERVVLSSRKKEQPTSKNDTLENDSESEDDIESYLQSRRHTSRRHTISSCSTGFEYNKQNSLSSNNDGAHSENKDVVSSDGGT